MTRDSRPFAALIIVCCLLAGGAVVWIQTSATATTRIIHVQGDDPGLVAAGAPADTNSTVAPSTTSPPTTAAPVVVTPTVPRSGLPRPAPPPPNQGRVYVAAPAAIQPIGTIEIPRIGLVHPIFEGNTLNEIDHGPSHWPGTAMPGQVGNAVFAGHRVTHTHPFLYIDRLQPGDQVIFTIGDQRFVYQVTGHDVVTPKDVGIVAQTATPTATLFACHPPHYATYRYVVHLALVQ